MTSLKTRVAGMAIAAALAVPTAAIAQDYPSKPIEMIVPFAAGGSSDTVARIVAEQIGKELGQNIVVVNKGGGRTEIGYKAAAAAKPDGYTIVMSVSSLVTNPLFYKNSFDASELVPVIYLDQGPYILFSSGLPVKTVAELIEHIKANPGKVSCALTGGLGSIGCEMIEALSGGKLLKAPYQGSAPATTDLLGGRVNLMLAFSIASLSIAQSDDVRALATTADKSGEPPMPELPSIRETLPEFELMGWHGISAPKGTPKEIVDRLNAAINAALKDPGVVEKLTAGGVQPAGGTPEDYAAKIASLDKLFRRVMESSGIRPQ